MDAVVKENINFIPVSYVGEIIEKALVKTSDSNNTEWKIDGALISQSGTANVCRQ